MGFTKNSTLEEIMKGLGNETLLKYFFPDEFVELVPQELWNVPLYVLSEKIIMPWGVPYISDFLIEAANAAKEIKDEKKYSFVNLWGDCDKNNENGQADVRLLVRNLSPAQTRPPVIICPGGGYRSCSSVHEGIKLAERMEAEGYFPFILYYRVKPYKYPAAQEDLALAIKYVRSQSGYYNIQKDNLMIMGASAGGHLCASVAALYKKFEVSVIDQLQAYWPEAAKQYADISSRPDKVVLLYPKTSFMDDFDGEKYEIFCILSGGDESLRRELSIETLVTQDFPKTFAWICEDDELIEPETLRVVGEAFEKNNVDHKVCFYPHGGHGCGLAEGTSAAGWMGEMLEFMK